MGTFASHSPEETPIVGSIDHRNDNWFSCCSCPIPEEDDDFHFFSRELPDEHVQIAKQSHPIAARF
jgi:hypothetical protein